MKKKKMKKKKESRRKEFLSDLIASHVEVFPSIRFHGRSATAMSDSHTRFVSTRSIVMKNPVPLSRRFGDLLQNRPHAHLPPALRHVLKNMLLPISTEIISLFRSETNSLSFRYAILYGFYTDHIFACTASSNRVTTFFCSFVRYILIVCIRSNLTYKGFRAMFCHFSGSSALRK
jgi:hypothetical protein